MKRGWKVLVVPVSCGLLFWGVQAGAFPGFIRVNDDGGGGPDINLIVREVGAAPVRAHVGDVIRVEMLVENHGDLGNGNARAEVLANGRVVASRMFHYGFGGEGDRFQRMTFHWDTKGVKPGEYKIRGETYVWVDSSPFDNFLDLEKLLVLLPAGALLPAGESGDGGSAMTRDPRYKPAAGSTDAGRTPAGKSGGY